MTPTPGRKVGHIRLLIDTTPNEAIQPPVHCAVPSWPCIRPSSVDVVAVVGAREAARVGGCAAHLRVLSNTTAGAWPIARHLDELLAP